MPTVPIVGAYYRPPAKAILDYIPVGARILLRAEPDNAHDANAIMVLVPGTSIPIPLPESMSEALSGFGHSPEDFADTGIEWHCGYIPRDIAAELTAQGFPASRDIEAQFSVSANGAPRVRFSWER